MTKAEQRATWVGGLVGWLVFAIPGHIRKRHPMWLWIPGIAIGCFLGNRWAKYREDVEPDVFVEWFRRFGARTPRLTSRGPGYDSHSTRLKGSSVAVSDEGSEPARTAMPPVAMANPT